MLPDTQRCPQKDSGTTDCSRHRSDGGFTLVELMIAVALLGILSAIAVPSLLGYLHSSEPRGFEVDRRVLQAAVDAWRSDVVNRSTSGWPTVGGTNGPLADLAGDGVDIGATSTVIKLSVLVTAGYIPGFDAVKSFAYSTPGSGTGATNSPAGSYVWYVDSNGLVQGRMWTDSAVTPGRIDLSELASADGFAEGVYP